MKHFHTVSMPDQYGFAGCVGFSLVIFFTIEFEFRKKEKTSCLIYLVCNWECLLGFVDRISI